MNKKGNSGIHIKPENRGKFTATKKATGKTTEELTHSKNPVTKKRAIFAQNAAKWKHEDGSKSVSSKKGSFPDLNKDGEITRADILKGRGVIKNGSKSMKADSKMCGSKGMKYQSGGKDVATQLLHRAKVSTIPMKIDPTRPSGPKLISSSEKPISNKKDSFVSKVVSKAKESENKKSTTKFKDGTKSIKFKKKEMIKRADGSVSQKGLWDNIRANKGSGKKPTPEMLKQEKKIKAGK